MRFLLVSVLLSSLYAYPCEIGANITIQNTCDWQCLGSTCTYDENGNDCFGDLICSVQGNLCVEPVAPEYDPDCTWLNHCISDPCETYDDCDRDLVCGFEDVVGSISCS